MTEKVIEAISILKILGLPKEQQNERSALTLLALLNLHPDDEWSQINNPMLGVTPIMNWVAEVYLKRYAPNSRETIRRHTLHQFVDAGLCIYNPDKPERPVNSPKACYQISPDIFTVFKSYGSNSWSEALKVWLSDQKTLVEKYAMVRERELIPLTLGDGELVLLSPGAHSKLIKDIVEVFAPIFVGGAEVIYIGDTGAKEDFLKKDRLKQLGVIVDRKGKMPDVVLYWKKKNWMILIESVTSHGPVDGKRYTELNSLFEKSTAGLVFVSAFPDRKTMTKFLSTISWETEVWTADAPSHLIHFNGDKFLGPYVEVSSE